MPKNIPQIVILARNLFDVQRAEREALAALQGRQLDEFMDSASEAERTDLNEWLGLISE